MTSQSFSYDIFFSTYHETNHFGTVSVATFMDYTDGASTFASFTGPNDPVATMYSEPLLDGTPQVGETLGGQRNLRVLYIPPLVPQGITVVDSIDCVWEAQVHMKWRVENTHATHSGNYTIADTTCAAGIELPGFGTADLIRTAVLTGMPISALAVSDGVLDYAGASGKSLMANASIGGRTSLAASPGFGAYADTISLFLTGNPGGGGPPQPIHLLPFCTVLAPTRTWSASGGSIAGDLNIKDELWMSGRVELRIVGH